MNYVNKYFELKTVFNLSESRISVDADMDIINLPFHSESYWPKIMDEQKKCNDGNNAPGVFDSNYFENNHFNYPVFVPKRRKNHTRAIILLHGLNERYWDKYLPWAYYLALQTQRPVILFPIAFHINRAPESWNNARALAPLLALRRNKFNTHALTFANVALSTRLTDDPLRFFKSGYQTAEDLILLVKQLEQGLIPICKKGTHVDFFAYSIGAFISQIMFLANPENVFSGSKLFLFSGGAFFIEMNGVSKLIMDQVAFNSIKTYYTSGIQNILDENKLLSSLFNEFPLGKAFYAMLREGNNTAWREKKLAQVAKQMIAVTLKNDCVIPARGTDRVFSFQNSIKNNEILDFPYDYSHETPFPVSGKANRELVDTCFNRVFSKASDFLD